MSKNNEQANVFKIDSKLLASQGAPGRHWQKKHEEEEEENGSLVYLSIAIICINYLLTLSCIYSRSIN